MMRQITLSIDSDLTHVALVGTALQGLCTLTPLSSSVIDQVQLSTVEWINNVIKHSYEDQIGHLIDIVVSIHHEKIKIEVKDQGRGMTPELINFVKMPAVEPTDLMNLPESGFGLVIIKEIMDEVSYHSEGHLYRLQMTKWF